MFSGIVEAVEPILSSQALSGAVRIQVKKPSHFNDLNIGDSVAINGVCLTVEGVANEAISFALAAETLLILKLDARKLEGQNVNLERSLRMGDRIHGNLVTGHVDSLGKITRSAAEGESWFMDVEVAPDLLPLFWKKGSVTLHGVGLTVNAVKGNQVSVCLIPETLKRTNLKDLKVGEFVNVEPDYFAKALVHSFGDRLANLLGDRDHEL
jgi:riboflavin synthase